MTGSRATLITQWFPPEPAWQPLWIAQAMRKAGLDVRVLTGVPNYPAGRVMPGYRAHETRTDAVDGFSVLRTPLYPSHDSRAIGRLLNYSTWALSASIRGLSCLRGSDVALVYSSPATAALPAMIARRTFRTPYVLLIQDVWPDSVFASGFLTGSMRKPIEWLLDRFVRMTYSSASHIVVTSPGMLELLVSRGVPRDKLTVVYNWVDEGGPASGAAEDWRCRLGLAAEDFVLMYGGNHGVAQALHAAIEGVAQVDPARRCHLVMVGDGVEKPQLKQLAKTLAPKRIHFVDPQPRENMAALMQAADAQLVSLADRPLFAVTTPSKLQSVMAAGHPVIAAAGGDVGQAVEKAGAGVAAAPEDPRSIADAILTLRGLPRDELLAMGANAQRFYLDYMSEQVGAATLCSVLDSAAKGATS